MTILKKVLFILLPIILCLFCILLRIREKRGEVNIENFIFKNEEEILCYKPVTGYEYKNEMLILNNCDATFYKFNEGTLKLVQKFELDGKIIDSTIISNQLFIMIIKNNTNEYNILKYDLDNNKLSEDTQFNNLSSLFKSDLLRNFNNSFFINNKLILFSIFNLSLNDLDNSTRDLKDLLKNETIDEEFLEKVYLNSNIDSKYHKYLIEEQMVDNVNCSDLINSIECSSFIDQNQPSINGEIKFIFNSNNRLVIIYYREKSFYIIEK